MTFKDNFCAVLILLIAFISISCGNSKPAGIYVPKEKKRIQAIEFKDGKARFTDSYLGIKQGCMDFQVKGSRLSIIHPFSGEMIFTIIDSDTIMSEIPGMNGLFIRQR